MLSEINDYIIEQKEADDQDDDPPDDSAKTDGNTDTENKKEPNEGTLILDATCVPSDMRFPTDASLLNQGREHLEGIIDEQHEKGLTNGQKQASIRTIDGKNVDPN